ncbi:MAG TPA: class I SAM-dependent methyltransferase [Pyrinomonadaceae bacterium]|nr:class I SAM-dependent methyltransferase [Pyrinomonadaceae bacterium]
MVKTLIDRAMRHMLFLAQSHPEVSDRWGYHIRPIHYYEPLPDFQSITSEQLARRREFPSIDFRWEQQLTLLHELARYQIQSAYLDNDYFSGFDAAVYYALIRHLKPKRVIEIGSGYSTRIAAKALGPDSTLTCIEPHPERLNGIGNKIELIQKRVEELDVEFFTCLEANDILFIDSSHTVKFGSDVCYEFLEVLPVLRPGVWIHVHDIFFPHDYPEEWLLKRRLALNEQYLLEAFLSFNRSFDVALANHWLTLDHSAAVRELWPGETSASSFWFYRRD